MIELTPEQLAEFEAKKLEAKVNYTNKRKLQREMSSYKNLPPLERMNKLMALEQRIYDGEFGKKFQDDAKLLRGEDSNVTNC